MIGVPSGTNLHYLVVPDTQALFVAKDRLDEVNPTFVRLIGECRDHCSLELAVPETVRGEVLYQKVTQALITAARTRDRSLVSLIGYAGIIYSVADFAWSYLLAKSFLAAAAVTDADERP